MNPEFLLSAIIFLPAVGALILSLLDSKAVDAFRYGTLIITSATFGLTLMLWGQFDYEISGIQMNVEKGWIPTWNIYYRLGVDGISLPLVLFAAFASSIRLKLSVVPPLLK